MNGFTSALACLLFLGCGADVVVKGGGPAPDADAGGDFGDSPSCVDEVVAVDVDGATSPVVANGAVYWATSAGGIFRRHLAESNNRELLTGLGAGTSLAVRGSFVYFASGSTVSRFDETTANVELIASEQVGASALAFVGGDLYWLNRGSGVLAGELMRWRPGGPAEVVLGSLDTPTGLAADDTHVYLAAKMVLWNDEAVQGALLRIATNSGEPTLLHAGINQAAGVAVSADRIYWIDQVDEAFSLPGHVVAMDMSGGSPETIALVDGLGIMVIADTDDVWFSVFDTEASRIRRVATNTRGTGDVVAMRGSVVGGLAMDADNIFVTSAWSSGALEPGAPSVQRLCRSAAR